MTALFLLHLSAATEGAAFILCQGASIVTERFAGTTRRVRCPTGHRSATPILPMVLRTPEMVAVVVFEEDPAREGME